MRRPAIDDDLPQFIEAVARCLRSGNSLITALHLATREFEHSVGVELVPVLAAADHGEPLANAFAQWAQSSASQSRRMVAAAIIVAHRVGGGAAQTFDGLASSLRTRNAARREAEVMATQARASAFVIGVAPVAFSVVVLGVDAGLLRSFLSPIGLTALLAGALFEASGLWWIARLVRGPAW